MPSTNKGKETTAAQQLLAGFQNISRARRLSCSRASLTPLRRSSEPSGSS